MDQPSRSAGFGDPHQRRAAVRPCPVAGLIGMRLEGFAEAVLHVPARRHGAVAAAVLLFGLPPAYGRDVAVDALHPHGVPEPQGLQALQVG